MNGVNTSVKRGVCTLLGWGSIQQSRSRKKEMAWDTWATEKPSSQAEPCCLLPSLPKELLCQDLWGAERLWQLNHWMPGEDPVFRLGLLLFYSLMDLGSPSPSSEAYNPHQMFHITQCEKPPILSDFLQVHTSVETWYSIFHSASWMSLWGMRVHMQQASSGFDQFDHI